MAVVSVFIASQLRVLILVRLIVQVVDPDNTRAKR